MNPSTERAGIDLPAPSPEQAGYQPAPAEGIPAQPEQQASGFEAGQVTGSIAPAALPTTIPPAYDPVAQQTNPAPAAGSAATDNITADDGDLIEKEWVNKAKAIVERTQSDPYTQSKELTVVRADYMKKRYDKSIKLSE